MGNRLPYSPEVRERAVRMVFDHESEHESQWATIRSVPTKIGCSAESLRNWVRQAERDEGRRPGGDHGQVRALCSRPRSATLLQPLSGSLGTSTDDSRLLVIKEMTMSRLRPAATLALSLLLCLTMAIPAGAHADQGAETATNIPCGLTWLNADLEPVRLEATGTVVIRPEAGTFTLRCKLKLPEDDPSLASFDEVCGVVGDYCINGVAIVAYDLLGCSVRGGHTSEDGLTFVTKSGERIFICHGTLDEG